MNAAQRHEHRLCAVREKPVDEEEGEYEAVDYVWMEELSQCIERDCKNKRRDILLQKFKVTRASPAYCL